MKTIDTNKSNFFANLPIKMVHSFLGVFATLKSFLPSNFSRLNKNYFVALIDIQNGIKEYPF